MADQIEWHDPTLNTQPMIEVIALDWWFQLHPVDPIANVPDVRYSVRRQWLTEDMLTAAEDFARCRYSSINQLDHW